MNSVFKATYAPCAEWLKQHAITRDELLRGLRELVDQTDKEFAHIEADNLLLMFIADKDILDAYDAVGKWYS